MRACVCACVCVRVCVHVCECSLMTSSGTHTHTHTHSSVMTFPNLLLEASCSHSSILLLLPPSGQALHGQQQREWQPGSVEEGRQKQQGVPWGGKERSAGLLRMVCFSHDCVESRQYCKEICARLLLTVNIDTTLLARVGGMLVVCVPNGILVCPGWYVEGSHNPHDNVSLVHVHVLARETHSEYSLHSITPPPPSPSLPIPPPPPSPSLPVPSLPSHSNVDQYTVHKHFLARERCKVSDCSSFTPLHVPPPHYSILHSLPSTFSPPPPQSLSPSFSFFPTCTPYLWLGFLLPLLFGFRGLRGETSSTSVFLRALVQERGDRQRRDS